MQENHVESIGELIVVEHKTLPFLFSEGKASAIVDEIENKVKSFVPDIETPKGRKDISSLAYKIARSKKIMDDAGKSITAEWKAKAKAIDQERSKIWSRLESLQEEIRRPLTEYEEKEKSRIFGHRNALQFFTDLIDDALKSSSVEEINAVLTKNEEHFNSRDWEEFSDCAREEYYKCEMMAKHSLSNLLLKIETKKREEAERKLKEERDRVEREELKRVKAEYEKLILQKKEEEYISSQQPIPDMPRGVLKAQEYAPIAWNFPEGTVGTCDLTLDEQITVYVVLEHVAYFDSGEFGIDKIFKNQKEAEKYIKDNLSDGDTRLLSIEEHKVIG